MNAPKPEKLICESCGKEFSCGANVGKCWCFEVEVKVETLAELHKDFKNCLCKNCLKTVKINFEKNMQICKRCQKSVGVISSFLTFNKQTNRCGNCEKDINNSFNNFRGHFINLFTDGVFSQRKVESLHSFTKQLGVEWQEALFFVRGDALHLLEKYLTFVSSDGIISQEEENLFHWLQNTLQIPQNLSNSLNTRLKYLKYVSSIRQGFLPTFNASTHLESDEICHLEINAAYHKVNLRSLNIIQGRFIITNKKIHFLSPTGGWTILWKNVMRVQNDQTGIYLELSTKSGNGYYTVSDSLVTEATITTITKLSKRQLLSPQLENQSRHIPQDVKNAVWQRDQGKCVQCRASSYLEFDHVIPFSKGGANTVNNVQLLCRNCNLKKRDRI